MKRVKIFLLMLGFYFTGLNIYAENNPIHIFLIQKKNGDHTLKIEAKPGFGIQREAPNKILLSTDGTLKIQNADLLFKGEFNLSKPEYFSKVNPFVIKTSGIGTLEVNARIYYCDYTKNICIPGKFTIKEKIKS